jgi:hypothetical protein
MMDGPCKKMWVHGRPLAGEAIYKVVVSCRGVSLLQPVSKPIKQEVILAGLTMTINEFETAAF